MADRTIATINGTMLVPGVSRNRRLYTPALIAKTVKRMQERIADPNGLPIVMRTHHQAGDDSRLIVGRVTSVEKDESGKAKYAADLYDTGPGKDIAALTTSDTPALRSVSIHGYWLGPVKRVQHEGDMVETADDLEIDAVDFTATPGVVGALLDLGTSETYESTVVRTAISESLDATVAVVADEVPEASLVEAYTAAQKKDALGKGQAMKNAKGDPSYTIKSKSDLRRAIRAVGRGGADHDRIRKHIIARAKALGFSSMIPDNWKADGSMKESTTRFGELREYYPDGPGGDAGFCVDAYNGPLSITMRACGIDPGDLRVVAAAAMAAACDALQSMDPDLDADIDIPGASSEDTDGDGGKPKTKGNGETVHDEAPALTETLAEVDEPPVIKAQIDPLLPEYQQFHGGLNSSSRAAITETIRANQAGDSTTHQEVPAVSEATTPAAETTAAPTTGRTLSDDDLKALGALMAISLKEAVTPLVATIGETTKAPKDKKAKAPTSETAAPTAESTPKAGKSAKKQLKEAAAALKESLQAELKAGVAETVAAERTRIRDELREEILRENGVPSRRGYRVHENDQGTDPTVEDLFEDRAQILLGDFGKTPTPHPGTGIAPAPTGPAAVAR